MNRRELVNAIAGHTGQAAKDVDNALRGMVDVILANVSKGEQVSIPGFAKFAKRQTKARMGRNPQTGESIRIKASVKARITPLKQFKDVVTGKEKAPKLGAGAAPAPAAKAAKAKKAPAKKAPAKKAPAKKSTAKKAKKATKKR